ncbi:hypothetical protein [Alicyclobacillus shizuokensis]|uniref:hypothetical protein n=1 Tax=Alicyclobacillus shizuokensis TaxID=392014 RepID=UPI000B03229F|nr:hypothetical protein [Alicyclobacillus shizuokensis]
MHSRETVWYICRRYMRGDKATERYYKRELLTSDSYRNLDSLYWSTERPITRRTWRKAQCEGYKCDTYTVYLPPLEVIPFPEGGDQSGYGRTAPQARRGGGQVVGLLRHRLRRSMGV